MTKKSMMISATFSSGGEEEEIDLISDDHFSDIDSDKEDETESDSSENYN